MQQVQPMGLHAKILAIMEEVEYLQKDIKVAFKTTKYSAISETKVTSTVRKSLLKHRLTFVPVSQTIEKNDNITRAEVIYQLTDAETNESIQVVSSGEGSDSQDKGVGKALTYAYKYALLRTFAIPTGDDPDYISSDEITENNEQYRQNLIQSVYQQYQYLLNCGYDKGQIDYFISTSLGYQVNDMNTLDDSTLKFLLNKLRNP